MKVKELLAIINEAIGQDSEVLEYDLVVEEAEGYSIFPMSCEVDKSYKDIVLT